MVNNIRLHPKCKDLLVYPVPPPHIFCSADRSAEKVNSFFYIWICIRSKWLSMIYQEGLSSLFSALTLNKWREILGGIYWKRQTRNQGLFFDKNVDAAFDLRHFWKNGDPLIFGHGEAGLNYDRSPLLSDMQSDYIQATSVRQSSDR